MPRNRTVRWAIWMSSCTLAAITVAVALKALPLTSQHRSKTIRRHQVAAVPVRPPQAAPAPQLMTRKSDRLVQRAARSRLRMNGIKLRSTGHCSNRYRLGCTSLDHIRRGSIDGVIALRQHSRCRLTVSGGTERGHAPGRFSHWNGYKIDVLPNRCIDRYITKRLRHIGVRGDGAEMYRPRSGGIYAREGSHWDLLFH